MITTGVKRTEREGAAVAVTRWVLEVGGMEDQAGLEEAQETTHVKIEKEEGIEIEIGREGMMRGRGIRVLDCGLLMITRCHQLAIVTTEAGRNHLVMTPCTGEKFVPSKRYFLLRREGTDAD
jgi:hypothetical protein